MTKGIFLFLTILHLVGTAPRGYPEPSIPKDRIPPDVAFALREEIENLYAREPADRIHAASRLGEMGEKAAAAVPFLVAILGDSAAVETDQGQVEPNSPGKEAAVSLVRIGKFSVKPLILALQEEEPLVREMAAWTLGKIDDARAVEPLIRALKDEEPVVRESAAGALQEITGEDFGQDQQEWQLWWNKQESKRFFLLRMLMEILRPSKTR